MKYFVTTFMPLTITFYTIHVSFTQDMWIFVFLFFIDLSCFFN